MIRNLIDESRIDYAFKLDKYENLSPSTYKAYCELGNRYFIKKTNLYTEEKFLFLYNHGLENILYPIKNKTNQYVTCKGGTQFFVSDFINDFYVLDEVRIVGLNDQLEHLHFNTNFKRQLSVSKSRYKMEDIYEYLQYKFSVLELFIRSVESRPFDEYSILILKNYHIILEAKKYLGQYHRKLISSIKEYKSVNYAFIHNNPKIDHLLVSSGHQYLTSIENSKVGIPSLDMAKLYIENENVNVDLKSLIKVYFNKYEDDFYYDYFCFLVLLYYIKSIVIIDKDYVSAQSMLDVSKSIKKFLRLFIYEDET